jgi:hypothetical protein
MQIVVAKVENWRRVLDAMDVIPVEVRLVDDDGNVCMVCLPVRPEKRRNPRPDESLDFLAVVNLNPG